MLGHVVFGAVVELGAMNCADRNCDIRSQH